MKTIYLSQGRTCIIDDVDFDTVSQYKWSFDPKGYAFRNSPRPNRKVIYLHRFLLQPKQKEYCDHINGDKLDNRRSNLRICTNAQNTRNRKIGINNTTGFKGISWNKRDKMWYASLVKDGKKIYLGCSKSKKQAAEYYNEGAEEHFGSFALLNAI